MALFKAPMFPIPSTTVIPDQWKYLHGYRFNHRRHIRYIDMDMIYGGSPIHEAHHYLLECDPQRKMLHLIVNDLFKTPMYVNFDIKTNPLLRKYAQLITDDHWWTTINQYADQYQQLERRDPERTQHEPSHKV